MMTQLANQVLTSENNVRHSFRNISHQCSASQPFSNHGTLPKNLSPDGTLHL